MHAKGLFSELPVLPPDPIFGLTARFKADPKKEKINLGVGIYQDETGNTPKPKAVELAESRIAETGFPQGYLPIDGLKEYTRLVKGLILSSEAKERAVTLQAPGGTGALRIAADFLASSSRRVWISNPTWANHRGIFQAAGLEVDEYDYYSEDTKSFSLSAMLGSLKNAKEGDIVVLHGCAHNPTGCDPTGSDWKDILALIQEKRLISVIDLAYQGLANSFEEDVRSIELFANEGISFFVASSNSKNFSLYNQRVGALTFIGHDSAEAEAVLTHLKRAVRTNYSNPPSHGARVVAEILADSELTSIWTEEVQRMRSRMQNMREQMVARLENSVRDFSYVLRQQGMFSYSGLSKEEVQKLGEDFSIYIVGSGRINVAGLNPGNLEYFCKAVATVCKLKI